MLISTSDTPVCSFHDHILYVPLDDYKIITASGSSASSFLNRQFTQDINKLKQGYALFSGYCSAKGKLLATLLFWKSNDTIQILMRSDLVSSFLKHISAFILREDIKFTIQKLNIMGVVLTRSHLEKLESKIRSVLPKNFWELSENSKETWISCPCSDPEKMRWFRITEHQEFFQFIQQEIPNQKRRIISVGSLWHEFNISSGFPWISFATQNIFTPQSVNLDLVNGISFEKGCYPGQEVVARLHYRGVLKKRLFYGSLRGDRICDDTNNTDSTDAIVMSNIIDGENDDRFCGRVMDCSITTRAINILFELNISSRASKNLHIGSKNGPMIEFLDLQYAVK